MPMTTLTQKKANHKDGWTTETQDKQAEIGIV